VSQIIKLIPQRATVMADAEMVGKGLERTNCLGVA